MALPTVDDLRRYLRIQTTGQNAFLEQQLVRALAATQVALGTSIAAVEKTWTLEDPRLGATVFRGLARTATTVPRTLRVPMTPVSAASVVLVDGDGLTVDTDDYRVNGATGVVTDASGAGFGVWPYTLTATVGYATRADYDDFCEPLISVIVTDFVADFYQRRNPAALQEMAGGGLAVTYNQSAETRLPSRIEQTLALLRAPTL